MQEIMCALIHIVDCSDNIVSLINGIWHMNILDNHFKNLSDTMFVVPKKAIYNNQQTWRFPTEIVHSCTYPGWRWCRWLICPLYRQYSRYQLVHILSARKKKLSITLYESHSTGPPIASLCYHMKKHSYHYYHYLYLFSYFAWQSFLLHSPRICFFICHNGRNK